MANDVINHAYVMTSTEHLKGQGLESFWVGEHVAMGADTVPREHGSALPSPAGLSHLPAPVLHPFLINW